MAIVESSSRLAPDMGVVTRYVFLDRLTRNGVVMLRAIEKCEGITDQGLVILTKEQKRQTIEADTIAPNTSLTPDAGLLKHFERKVPEIHLAGDCLGSNLILDAIRDGYRIGCAI